LIGSVYLLMRYLDEMNNIFYRFTGMYGDILIRRSRVGNSEELTPLFRDESFANHVLPTKWRNICVDGLDFSYPDGPGESLHLENISLQIRRGERIAFVGESGSGKTTLLKVMRSLYQPRTMELAVDGAKIGQGFEGICRAIALIPQNPEIFATTILDNITLGAVYSPEKVKQFADMACFSEVVEALPRQYSSKINERGVNLSGGQQQRLALARGLLASVDKSIVLLDEPTSSVDIGNEMKIYRNIFDGFKDTSVISSIHRLHLLPMFDRIYLFDKGRIVASGSLDELLATCTSFRTLWEQYNDGEQRTGNTVRV
jgi:ABC-type multidrug transport system fused ATPase/permease subunit